MEMRLEPGRWIRPWWLPGPLLRAYALAAVGLVGYVLRLSLDPWTQEWRVPGRSLLILLVQPLPIAVGFLVFWSALSRWRRPTRLSLWAAWIAAGGLAAFSAFDGVYSTIAERHLLEPGQLRFLFLDGAFWASGFLSIRLVASVALLLGLYAYFLVKGFPRPAGPPPLRLLAASVFLLLGVNIAALSLATGSRRDLYAYAISANPIPGALELPARLATTVRPGIRTVVRGLVPQREMKRSAAPPQPSRALIEPRVFLVILLDGFRADYLTPERTPNLYALANRSGVVLNRYYTSYPGTDLSVYSLLYASHPFYADQAFMLGLRPVPRWFRYLRRHGYRLQAYQSNPNIYRYLPPIYGTFDEVLYGTADVEPHRSDEAMLSAAESAVTALPDEGRLFAFVLLHSTHFPYNGKMLGSPDENFGDAVRFLDDRVGRLIQRLEDRNTSFLALVGGDHGTLLGDCGRVGYTAIHDASLHTAMLAVGSKDTAPALERLSRLRDSMITVPSLLPLILDPDPGVARRDSPESQWNVAMLTSVSSATASLTAHNVEGDALRVELGRNAATWTCGRLDECAAPVSDACRPELLRQAGDALLKLQRPNPVPPGPRAR